MGGASKFIMLLSTPLPLLYPRPSALRIARHSRVSIACFSAFQNRRFTANSRRLLGFTVKASEQIHTQTSLKEDYGESIGFSPNSRVLHPWPEWSKLVESLKLGGYFDREVSPERDVDDAFSLFDDPPDEFVRAVNACLSFARDRSDLLRSLSRKDIEVVVENGSPFLFKNAMNSTRRMRSFLGTNGDVLEFERACTVDLMRFLLTYAFNALVGSGQSDIKNKELVEASVRNLLSELVDVGRSVRESNVSESMPRQFPARYGQSSRTPGQNIEMKRGDWICQKCSFMNFARNTKCFECNEGRPKRQLTGGEWECPQCDFYNYGRNSVCLRCDCKRPGETQFSTSPPMSGYSQKPNIGPTLYGSNSGKAEIESRLAANDEKAERWFSKISQLDNASDMSSAVADEDFPEIMPLRKGVNRFVVSTRKTPLERRLANAQYRRNLGNDGSAEGNDFPMGEGAGGFGPDKTSETSVGRSLDRILGRSSSAASETDSMPDKNENMTPAKEENSKTERRFTSPQYRRNLANGGSDSGYVPFVPLPADMFAKPQTPKTEEKQASDKDESLAVKASELTDVSEITKVVKFSDGLLAEKPENQTEIKKDTEQTDASERWFKKVAELHDVTDLASAISDEDFPEIMPMRKGENRFVVSKKKDRSLTSPQYKRRLAMEQANSSNFVPFVPFPPDYFAKKDKQPESGASTEKAATAETSAISEAVGKISEVSEKSEESNKVIDSNWGASGNSRKPPENQQINNENWSAGFSGKTNNSGSWNSGYSGQGSTGDAVSATGRSIPQQENPQNGTESWNRGFSGKSLEGSAVKEPDPLDMSEEAKAERWFRRVAQIKDISELSQIPDEDFPEIMPMRKGVNRFVVSKRKTPLERRLTSPQYRRNLPIVSSDPEKDPS
eukprot:TRINITY_DN188_c0_g1_i1.p1 TRINITY_DN188_c0_g1~~TRINITY_DN188_c0_g1_i1.p1  ORF type:complete len:900 (-),score=187.36 TRINITY_DN188_c0_g1_i1:184-2883(-)